MRGMNARGDIDFFHWACKNFHHDGENGTQRKTKKQKIDCRRVPSLPLW
jgi:hypothetical protein